MAVDILRRSFSIPLSTQVLIFWFEKPGPPLLCLRSIRTALTACVLNGIVWSPLHVLNLSLLTTTLWGRLWSSIFKRRNWHPEVKYLIQSHTASKRGSQNLNPGGKLQSSYFPLATTSCGNILSHIFYHQHSNNPLYLCVLSTLTICINNTTGK